MRVKKILTSALALMLSVSLMPVTKSYASGVDEPKTSNVKITDGQKNALEEQRKAEGNTEENDIQDISNGEYSIKEKYTPNINDYELINPDGFVGYMLDSYYTYQQLTFNTVSEYTSEKLQMQFSMYSDYAYAKDSYYSFEFFTQSGSYLNYLTTVTMYNYGYNRMRFTITADKSIFEDQKYIYIRVGTRNSLSSSYYSDTLTFKVANPFYKSPTANLKTFTTSVSSGAEVGTKIKLNATSDISDAYYEFYAKESKDSSWTKLKGMGAKNYAYWTPEKPGTYKLRVRAKNQNSSNKYDSYKDLTFVINPKKTTQLTGFKTSSSSGVVVDTKIKLTATSDLANSQYEFYAKESKDSSWTKLKGMGPKNYAYWTPSKPGTYTLRVRAKGPESTKKYDSYKDMTFVVKEKTTTKITSFKTSVASGAKINTQIKVSAASDLANSQYEFYVKESNGSSWTKLKGMGPKNYAYWTPTKAGTYTLRVRAKGPNSTNKYDSYKDMSFTVSK